MEIEKLTPDLERIVKACYPNYTGRKFHLSTNIPKELNSYWDGGSKTDYIFYELATGKSYHVHSNHPFFEHDKPRVLNSLPNGVIIVAHSIFCGKDSGITFYSNPQDLTPSLPQNIELTENEKIVLTFTASLKPCYAGISNYRFHQANKRKGISLEDWNNTKETLVNKGLLNKAGAITTKGRNAISSIPHDYTW